MIKPENIQNILILLGVLGIGLLLGFIVGDFKANWFSDIEERLNRVEVMNAALKGDTTIIQKAYVNIHSDKTIVLRPPTGDERPEKIPEAEIRIPTRKPPGATEAIDLHWKMNFGRFK